MKHIILFVILTLIALNLTFAQTAAGNSISLNGDGDYAWVPDNVSLNPQSEITVEAWVWSDNYDRGQWQEFVMKGGNDPGTPRQYYIRPRIGEGRVQFIVHNTNNDDISVSSDNPLTNGAWYHVAGTYDQQTLRLYINGVLLNEDDAGSFTIQTSKGILAFGRLGDIGAEYFDGNIDEVRIWEVARTQSQLVSTMTDTLDSAYYSSADSGLVGYWRFDVFEDLGVNSDGSDDIRDFSIYENHADTEGNPMLVPSGALVSVEKLDDVLPSGFILTQNYPNPFNPSTTIRFSIVEESFVILKIFNSLGEEITTLINEDIIAGSYEVEFDATSLTSGIYFYKLQVRDFVQTKKMVLIK